MDINLNPKHILILLPILYTLSGLPRLLLSAIYVCTQFIYPVFNITMIAGYKTQRARRGNIFISTAGFVCPSLRSLSTSVGPLKCTHIIHVYASLCVCVCMLCLCVRACVSLKALQNS